MIKEIHTIYDDQLENVLSCLYEHTQRHSQVPLEHSHLVLNILPSGCICLRTFSEFFIKSHVHQTTSDEITIKPTRRII